MDRKLAARIANQCLEDAMMRPYAELALLQEQPESFRAVGTDGKSYNLKMYSHLDSTHGTALRVVIAIDDGGWSAFVPVTVDFIMESDGSILD